MVKYDILPFDYAAERVYNGFMLDFWKNYSEISLEEQGLLDGDSIKYSSYSQSPPEDKFHDLCYVKLNPRFSLIPLHRHDYFEIMYVHSGKIRYVMDGNTLELIPGNIIVTPKGCEHSCMRSNYSDTAVSVIFTDVLLSSLEPGLNDGFLCGFIRDAERTDYLLYYFDENSPQFNILENLIFALSGSGNSVISGKLAAIFLDYLNTGEGIKETSYKSKGSGFKQKVNSYIENNMRGGTIVQLASDFGYDWQYLSRKITASFGKSFKEILLEKRIMAAESMLKETKLPVSEISRAVGYTESSYFYKIFYEKHNLTPSQWRKAQQLGD